MRGVLCLFAHTLKNPTNHHGGLAFFAPEVRRFAVGVKCVWSQSIPAKRRVKCPKKCPKSAPFGKRSENRGKMVNEVRVET